MGQKSTYTQWAGEMICAGLAEGKPLLSVCEALGIAYSTAMDWERDIQEHGVNSTRARVVGCHAMADRCIEIACNPMIGEERTIKPDGSIEVREGDMIQHRKLMIDTHLRLLGKWLPKVYGDKVELGGSLTVKKAAADMTDDELLALARGATK